jgi:hypothetical protein
LGITLRVEVYYNLHKKTFSVRALEGENRGRVIAHTNEVALEDVKFVVRESGRQKVLKEKCKNVHAFVRGNLVNGIKFETNGLATYNPYRYSTFVNKETKDPVYESKSVLMLNYPYPEILYA